MKSKPTVFLWMLYDFVVLTFSLVMSIMIAVNFHMSGWNALVDNMHIFSYMVLSASLPNVLFLYFTKRYKVIWKYASPIDYCVVIVYN